MACQVVVNLKHVNKHFSTWIFFFYLYLSVAFVWIIKTSKRHYIVMSFFCLLPKGHLPCHESVSQTLKYYFFTHSLQWEWSSCLVAFQRQEGEQKSTFEANEFLLLEDYNLNEKSTMTYYCHSEKKEEMHITDRKSVKRQRYQNYLPNMKHMWCLEHRSSFPWLQIS